LLKHPYTARKIVELFAKEIVRLHGIPLRIISVAGNNIENEFNLPSGD